MKKLITTVGLAEILASCANAQFATFDVATFGQALLTAQRLLQQYQVLNQTYQTTTNAYQQLVNNAKQLAGKDGWRYVTSPLLYPSGSNQYGTSGGWITTLNTGEAAVRNYEMATVRASNPYSIVSGLSTADQNRFAQHYATVELNDAAAQHAMGVTGALRANAAQQAQALRALQNASLSGDPAMNSEVGVLNTVSAAGVIQAQSLQDTNRMLAAMSDQQIIDAKVRHDVLIDEINNSIATAATKQASREAIWGTGGSLTYPRLP
jgi:hypothetical protein